MGAIRILGLPIALTLLLAAKAVVLENKHEQNAQSNQATQHAASAYPLILNEADGEHLLRRYPGQTQMAPPGSTPEFIIKIDKQNGNAEDFVALTENLKPGAVIHFHKHHNAEEVLVLEEGGATVTVGDKRALASPRAVVFIPRETWVSVTNSASHPIHLYALFSRPGFEEYLRARSVHPGEPLTPLTSEERRRAEELGRLTFWDVSEGPYPPGVAQSAAQSGRGATQSPAAPHPLILQEGDGEHRVGRPAGVRGSFPFTIKVDRQNGNAEDFFVVIETMAPGDAIPFHMHHNAEEVVIFEEGGATVTVGDKRAVVGPRSIAFIPRETWVSISNSSTKAIHIYGLFSRQGFDIYMRALSVSEGQPVTPFNANDLPRLRATGHATYWDTSKGPYPPGVPHE